MQIDFKKKIDNYGLGDEKIAVAFSGGADSMAMALLLHEYFGDKMVAITVDHKLRPESSKEAKQVGKWVEARGIKHKILSWEGEKPTANIEAIARKKRYQLLCDYCKENGIKNLFVAHNLNDQAETFLLRLRRSSGLFGLGGMEEVGFFQKVKILRPLLDVPRENIENFLKEQKQEFVHDSFNDDNRYERVRVRKFLPQLEEIGITAKTISESMKLLQADKAIMKERINKIFEEKIKINPIGFFEMDFSVFSEDFSIFIYVMSEFFTRLGLDIPRAEKIQNLYKKGMESNHTVGGFIFYKAKDKILIAPEYERIKNLNININAGKTITFLGFEISAQVDCVVTTLGDKTSKIIKKAGVPSLIKRALPLIIIDGKEIIPFISSDNNFNVIYNPFDNYINSF